MAATAPPEESEPPFPEVGEMVTVRHNGRWRRAEVLRAYATRRPPYEMAYDVALEPDGEWTPQELAKFRAIFDRVDVDGSGFIDTEELRNCLLDLGHPAASDDDELADIVRRVDKDGSGEIEFDEFIDLLFVELKDVEDMPDFVITGVRHGRLRRARAPRRVPREVSERLVAGETRRERVLTRSRGREHGAAMRELVANRRSALKHGAKGGAGAPRAVDDHWTRIKELHSSHSEAHDADVAALRAQVGATARSIVMREQTEWADSLANPTRRREKAPQAAARPAGAPAGALAASQAVSPSRPQYAWTRAGIEMWARANGPSFAKMGAPRPGSPVTDLMLWGWAAAGVQAEALEASSFIVRTS